MRWLVPVVLCAASSFLAGCNGCNPSTGTIHDGGTDGGGDAAMPACMRDSDCGGATLRCCSSVCVETASCGTAVTSASPARGFQNGGEFVTLHGAGFAPGMRVYIADGRAPVRVIDASTALIQAPPGPVGARDLKIDVAGQVAILHGGYTYRSAGLEMRWEQKPLARVRGEDPALAVMQDGRVLVAGGTTVPDSIAMALNTAEIYNRVTDTVTPVASTMSAPRWQDSAVTLLTGKVLVVGGACTGGTCNGDATTADLFDPATSTFSPTTGKLNKARSYPRSVLLVDGRVLIASSDDPSVEIYDPATDRFTLVAHTQLHVFGFIVRLRDGRVLLGAGDGGVTAAELFDSDLGTFTPTAGPMAQGRSMLTAHTLPDSRVVIIAGASMSAGGIKDPLASIEFFDPTTSRFTAASYRLATTRCWHASALVRDGTILVMGGYTVTGACSSSSASVEVIDPVAGSVAPFPMLLNTNAEWTAVTLLDGSVLGVGGGACQTATALPDIDFLAGTPVQ